MPKSQHFSKYICKAVEFLFERCFGEIDYHNGNTTSSNRTVAKTEIDQKRTRRRINYNLAFSCSIGESKFACSSFFIREKPKKSELAKKPMIAM